MSDQDSNNPNQKNPNKPHNAGVSAEHKTAPSSLDKHADVGFDNDMEDLMAEDSVHPSLAQPIKPAKVATPVAPPVTQNVSPASAAPVAQPPSATTPQPAPSAPEPPTQQNQPASPNMADEYDDLSDLGDDVDDPYAVAPPPKKKSMAPVGALLGVLVLCGAGYFGYTYLTTKAHNDKIFSILSPQSEAQLTAGNQNNNLGSAPQGGDFDLGDLPPQPTTNYNADGVVAPQGVIVADTQPMTDTFSANDFSGTNFGTDTMDAGIETYGGSLDDSEVPGQPQSYQVAQMETPPFPQPEIVESGQMPSFPDEARRNEYSGDNTVSAAQNSIYNNATTQTPPPIGSVPYTGQPQPQGTIATSQPPSAASVANSGPNVYYDSNLAVPSGTNIGIRKVNPIVEPSSRYVVVNRTAGANSLDAEIETAKRALSLNRYDAALDLYTRLYSKNNRDPRILMGMAYAQQKTGQEDAALRTYEQLLDIDSNNADALVNLLGILKNQYPSVALRRLEALRMDHPSHPGIVAQLGIIEAGLQDYDNALKHLGLAASIEPHNPKHFYNMAIVSDQAKRYSHAMELYQKALEVDSLYGGGTLPRDTIYERLSKLRHR